MISVITAYIPKSKENNHMKILYLGSLYNGLKKRTISVTQCLAFSFSVSWRASKAFFILRVIFEAFGAVIPVILAFIGKQVINLLVYTVQKGAVNEDIISFVRLLVIILMVQFLSTLIQRANELCSEIHKDKVSYFLNIQLLKKTAELDISFFDSPRFHDEVINARRDSQSLQTLAWVSIAVIRALLQLFIAVPILFRMHWLLPLILIITKVPAIIIEKKYVRKTYKWMRKRAPEERKLTYIQNILTGQNFAKDLRLFGLFNELLSRYTALWNKWFMEKRDIAVKRVKWTAVCSTLPQIGSVVITFFIGIQIIYKRLSIGDYGFYNGISGQISGAVNILVNAVTQIYDGELKISNYIDFLQWKSRLFMGGTLQPSVFTGVKFRDVSFKYPDTEKYILKNLNLEIKAGEKIALVGLNGAGKSTIVKLMLRFYDPSEGQILINDIDIREYDISKLRKLFTTVFQDYSRYAFSARENIAISDFEYINEESRIYEACSASGVDRILNKWKSGLDSYLTKQFEQGGEELSGGEWQKIAIARAFFRNTADILILDEPTASLDPEAEHSIFERFAELCHGKTAFFISHRLSNVTMADRILVLKDGKVVEMGSHNELMKSCGEYARLFNLQAEKYISKIV